ncbi:hypothetical protein NVP1244A_094 [Vibrio phage 1.244.A._10N.261.54.C3]|nr:hypothetical protein NVP1244A_094 [Vibrio phage 1.244.A._10N.261.54.C3]AUR98722.1 hypothetical protein NVP1255O_094 [Vibrio phage 1.255.O._10N.286.45.F1]
MFTKGLTAQEVIDVLTKYKELDGSVTLGDDPMWFNRDSPNTRTRHTSVNRVHVRAIFIDDKLEALFKRDI